VLFLSIFIALYQVIHKNAVL